MTAAETCSSPIALVTLGPDDGDRYYDHLMRLDADDRRFRFFEEPEEYMIALHAGAAVADGRIVLAWESDGQIRGAVELLADPDEATIGELAFSIERDWRKRGLGSKLMREIVALGRARGFARLELEMLSENEAMQAMARKFASSLGERGGNMIAKIDLASYAPRTAHNQY